MMQNESGILLAIDFEKAFDSLNHEFLYQVYRKWVLDRIFFNGLGLSIGSCQPVYQIMALQLISFFVKRVVRQGDPLSALSVILHWKRFYVKFKKKNIKGFLINGKDIKTTLFADDMTCFLRDTNSYFQLLTSLQNLARYSGLRVNDEKTESFAIGPHSLVQDVFTAKIRSMIKISGVYFNYDTPARLKVNCESIFISIQGTLNSWKGRGLTLKGKIQIVLSLLLSRNFLAK